MNRHDNHPAPHLPRCLIAEDEPLLAAGLRAFYDAMDRYTLADLKRGPAGEQIVTMHREFLRSAGSLPAA